MEINTATISGRATRDPDMNMTKSGVRVAHLTIAQNDRHNNGMFYNLSLFGPQAEWCEKYVRKGSHVVVVNTQVMQRVWTDKNGNTQNRIAFEGGNIGFYSSSRRRPGGQAGSEAVEDQDTVNAQDVENLVNNSEDLPF